MAVDVTVNPDLSLFDLCKVFKHLLCIEDLGLKLLLWVDPLPVSVKTDSAVTVIAADDSVRVEAWNQNKSVELTKKSRLFGVGD